MSEMINVFDYLDYREYLKDTYTALKKKDNKYSQRYFVQKLGVKSTGFFAEILKGKRNLTQDTVLRFSKILKHDSDEYSYFESLVNFNQARTLLEKDHWLLRMMECSKVNPKILNRDVYAYFSKWYYSAVRELLFYYRKPVYPNEIAELLNPTISIDEAAEALSLLERLELIKGGPDGTFQQNDALISTGDQVNSVVVANYQLQMLELAKLALEGISSHNREVSTLTISISGDAYEKIVDIMKKARQDILKVTQQDSNEDRVYQVNIQLFPLTIVD